VIAQPDSYERPLTARPSCHLRMLYGSYQMSQAGIWRSAKCLLTGRASYCAAGRTTRTARSGGGNSLLTLARHLQRPSPAPYGPIPAARWCGVDPLPCSKADRLTSVQSGRVVRPCSLGDTARPRWPAMHCRIGPCASRSWQSWTFIFSHAPRLFMDVRPGDSCVSSGLIFELMHAAPPTRKLHFVEPL
jgi:hypothetical protein